MNYLENKYILQLSNRFRNFRKHHSGLVQFSCPICGDSETHKRKARGYLYSSRTGKTTYHCHNCNVTMSFDNFLQTIDPCVYDEFRLERMGEYAVTTTEIPILKMKRPVFVTHPLDELAPAILEPKALKFLHDRMIPMDRLNDLYWCDNFYVWTNSIISDKFDDKSLAYDHGRIIIPFINAKGDMHAFQGRSLGVTKDNMKYITIIVDDSVPKIFGLDKVDWYQRTYVFEGPFDSMFIPNSIATAGGDLVSVLDGYNRDNAVIVYDNEPRSKQTIAKMIKAINAGYKIVVWPNTFVWKDVNEAIVSGYNEFWLNEFIDNNTYEGLSAMMAITQWRKI